MENILKKYLHFFKNHCKIYIKLSQENQDKNIKRKHRKTEGVAMFKRNDNHLQCSLFGIENQLPELKQKKLESSKEYLFYRLIFCNINEELFSILYSEKGSRPNAPINALVSAIILLYHSDWTTEELFKNIDFNILTRAALGLDTLHETPFCPATFFNFQNRLLQHYKDTGENLIEIVFDNLTEQQLKALKIKTNIQRTDSFMALSNIRNYSRVQLLVEMLIRLEKILNIEDKEKYANILSEYLKKSSEQYIYKLKRDEIPHKLEELGKIYYELYTSLKEQYKDIEIFQIFERVYKENFIEIATTVEVKSNKEITSDSLQSPDDIDATYRKKNGTVSKGQSVTVTETCNSKNEIDLITDIAVTANNIDDSKILNERIETIKEKTPELNELHTDGAYGSIANDKKMEELEIEHIQTGCRGPKPKTEIEIEKNSEDDYIVKCPCQEVKSTKTANGHKACFKKEICANCKLSNECKLSQNKKGERVYYFNHKIFIIKKRNKLFEDLPPEKQKLRANVEATVKEFTKPLNHKGKLKVRGKFKSMIYAFSMGISINYGRIYRYIKKNSKDKNILRRITNNIKKIFQYLRRFFYNSINFGQNDMIPNKNGQFKRAA